MSGPPGNFLRDAEPAPLALRFIETHRTSSGPFDIIAGGPERGPDAGRTRELIRQSAQAGATWFSQWIPPGDPATMRAVITQGPVRIDAV